MHDFNGFSSKLFSLPVFAGLFVRMDEKKKRLDGQALFCEVIMILHCSCRTTTIFVEQLTESRELMMD